MLTDNDCFIWAYSSFYELIKSKNKGGTDIRKGLRSVDVMKKLNMGYVKNILSVLIICLVFSIVFMTLINVNLRTQLKRNEETIFNQLKVDISYLYKDLSDVQLDSLDNRTIESARTIFNYINRRAYVIQNNSYFEFKNQQTHLYFKYYLVALGQTLEEWGREGDIPLHEDVELFMQDKERFQNLIGELQELIFTQNANFNSVDFEKIENSILEVIENTKLEQNKKNFVFFLPKQEFPFK